MSVDRIIHDIDHNPVQPVYWIYGKEKKLIDDITAYLTKKIKHTEKSIYFGNEIEINQIVASLFEIDLFATNKLLIIRECHHINWTEESEKAFVRWLKNPLPEYHLIFNGLESKDIPKVIYSSLKNISSVFEIKPLYEKEIIPYIKNLAEKNQKHVSTEAINQIVDLCGTDLHEIHSQWEKLLLFIGNKDEITLNDVLHVIGLTAHFNVFQLIDSMMTGQYKKCLKIIKSIMDAGNHPLQSLSMLIRHFNQLERMSLHIQGGTNLEEVKAELNIRDFQFRKLQHQVKYLPYEKIQNIIIILSKIDGELKTRATSVHHSNIIFEKGILNIFNTLKL